MAYADANTKSRNLTTGAAVIAIEVGLAWAIVTGLAITAHHVSEERIAAFQVPKATPSPAPPPPQDPSRRVIEPPVVVPNPVFTLTPIDPTPFARSEPSLGDATDGTIRDFDFPGKEPLATASAKPLYTPKAAKPKGDSSRWLTTDDYPRRGLLNQREGRTSYRLSIDASGRVTSCSVVKSSGFEELDQATCQLLPRRARFEPARDEAGAAVSGSYAGSVTWRLPPEE